MCMKTLSALLYVHLSLIYLHMGLLVKVFCHHSNCGSFYFFGPDGQWKIRMAWFSSPYGKFCISVHRCTLGNIISPIISLLHNIIFHKQAKGLFFLSTSFINKKIEKRNHEMLHKKIKSCFFMQLFLYRAKKTHLRALFLLFSGLIIKHFEDIKWNQKC